MRAKTRKGAVKRIKVSKGEDRVAGKLMVNRPNDNHRNIRKPRERLLRGRRPTVLSAVLKNLRKII